MPAGRSGGLTIPAVPVPLARWPLVGRRPLLDHLIGALGPEPRCLVVTGAAGIGKTRVAAELASAAEDRGWALATAMASRSAAGIPYGALAPLLPTEHVLADTPAGMNRRAARAIRELGDGAPVLLVVDDAHTLDDASASLVHELVHEGAVSVVLTVRDGEHPPAPILDLMADPTVAEQLAVGPLGAEDVAELVDAVLVGAVDGAVAHRIWERSAGNALYVRELLLGALESGTLRRDDGLWRWSRGSAPPTGLVDLVAHRIGGLSDGDVRALAVLAVARGLGRDDADHLVGAEAVERLLERGFLTEGLDGRRRPVRLAHPVYEDALRSTVTRARKREVSRLVAERVAHHGARRRGDHLHAVTLLLDAGAVVSVDLLESAARESYLAYDLELTERVARAAMDGGAAPALTRILGEILRWQGRHREAEDLLAAVDLREIEDEGDAALMAIVRAECLFRGLACRADAEAVLLHAESILTEPAWRAELRACRAEIAALAGDVDDALAMAMPVLAADPHPRASVVAAGAAGPALLAAGRADDAAAIAERAFSVALGLGPQPAIAHPALQAIVQAMALVESGRLEDAEGVARTGYEWSLASGFPIGQAWFALALGWGRLLSGRLTDAERLFREAAVGFRDLGELGLRRWALAGVVQAASWRGERQGAAEALAAMPASAETALQLADVEVERAAAWVAVMDGEHSRAIAELTVAAERARRRGQYGFELAALHDVVRLGEARAVLDRVQALEGVQGGLARARRSHAVALAGEDPAGLESCGDAFADLGAHLFAAEAYAHAAGTASRRGERGAARALVARAEAMAAACGASSPVFALARRDPAQLTRREAEIAGLAARGRTSADIAEVLGISVRTVGNHLQRAYAKLGVSDRTELSDAIERASS